ncbi:restriction endonuclease subunit S [Spongiimicrobium salis]|uniref:restriction endonuclease subunit S n=1 Tax=Spongiimicrobium salis TaxID=1667022 RepID=UPI00374DB565
MKEERLVPELRFKGFKKNWRNSSLNKECVVNPKSPELPIEFIYIDLESVSKGILVSENKVKREGAPSRAQRLLKTNDIIFQTVRPYQKNNYHFKFNKSNYVSSTGYAQLRTENESAFIYQMLHTELFVNKVLLRSTGSSYPAINSSDLGKIKVNLPNLEEQQKIATFLTSVDTRIEQLTQKKELLEQYKKGVMQQLLSQQLRFKDDDGKGFPEWEEKSIKVISSLIKDGTHSTHKDYPKSGYLLLSAKNLVNGKLSYDENDREISESDYNQIYKNYKLKRDDILLSIVGTIGRVVRFDGTQNIAFQRSVAFFRFETENPSYVEQYMKAEGFQRELLKRKTIGAQPGIYLGDLSKITVKLPSLVEQQKIADFLSSIDTKITQVASQIEKSKEFKKGLLQQMFV